MGKKKRAPGLRFLVHRWSAEKEQRRNKKKNSAFTEKKFLAATLKTKKSNPKSNIDVGAFSHGGFLGGAAHPLLPADPNPESVHPHGESSSLGLDLLRRRYLPAPPPRRLAARLPQSRRCLQKVDFSILGKSDGRSVTDLCIISLLLLSTREKSSDRIED
ncbi:hypothetical protein STAS_10170 [Striga asiatica]|uniref:Uncharacterized protein n=1 Tax=Striga asiatica TaxID=4170 RepID=A0A5A7PNV9_STRAF|nr:hypothetical protein STAS_10170 [Striga asiatica]